MQREFAEHGYDKPFKFPNPIEHAAILRHEPEPEQAAAVLVAELLATAYPGGEHNVLVVSSPERLEACASALTCLGVNARIGESVSADTVTVVAFNDSKGLEREVVVVVGVEDLFIRGHSSGLFEEATVQIDEEARSRRKVYVALTRAMERLYIFYSDRAHPFIKQLCDLNDRIARKRIKG